MNLRQVVQTILEDCPICNFHSDSYAEMHCPDSAEHTALRDALDIYEDELKSAQNEAANNLERADELEERIKRVQTYAETAHHDLERIKETVDLDD